MTPRLSPPSLAICIVIGALQSAGLAGYAIAIGFAALTAGSDQGITGSSSTPLVTVAVFAGFAFLLGAVVRGLLERKSIARTPFIVAQLFGLVVGGSLFSSDDAQLRGLAIGVCVAAVVGIGAALAPTTAAALDS